MNTEINDIVISDKKEHLRIITEDIVIQSSKLSHILQERDGIISDIKDKQDELLIIENKCKNVYDNIINLESIKEKLNQEISDKNKEIDIVKQDILKNKDTLNRTITDLNNSTEIARKELNILISLKESIIKDIYDLKARYDSDVEYYKSKQEKVSSIKKEYEELKNIKQDFCNSFELEKKNKLSELKALDVELSNALEIIKNPIQSLNNRESILDKRERNFEILVSRFRKEFKKLHPDLNPVI